MQEARFRSGFWLLLDIFIGVLVVIMLIGIPVALKFSNSIPPAKMITVTGDGKVTAVPDIGVTTFSIVSRGPDPQAIAEENNKKMTKAIDWVKSQGIDAKDVQTSGYNLQPVYAYDRQTGKSSITGYELTQQVTIKIRDLSKISKIMGGLPDLGVNQVSGLSFQIDDPENVKKEARDLAFAKARAKAEAMAKAAGIALGDVISVGEEQGSVPVPYRNYAMKSMDALGMGGAVNEAAPIEAGSQDVTVTVSITYALK